MYFDKETIYSYSTAIGRIIPDLKVIFINSSSYSVTTSKHQSYVGGSIPPGYTKIHYDAKYRGEYVLARDPIELAREAVEQQINKAAEIAKGVHRKRQNRRFYIEDIYRIHERVRNIVTTLNLNVDPDEIFTRSGVTRERLTELYEEAENFTRKARERAPLDEAKVIEDWKNFKRRTIPRAYSLPPMLRMKGDVVETSLGATVNAQLAKRLYLSWKSKKDIIGEKVGGYTVISKNDAEITIGCHRIPVSEVESFASQVGWDKEDVALEEIKQARTEDEALAEAAVSGVIDAWVAKKPIYYREEGGEWKLFTYERDPVFSDPKLHWKL